MIFFYRLTCALKGESFIVMRLIFSVYYEQAQDSTAA